MAQLPSGFVTYTPGVKIIQGNQPLVALAEPDPSAPVNPYYVTIIGPATGVTFPYRVTLSFSILRRIDRQTGQQVPWKPAHVPDETALSFITAYPAELKFTKPNQSLQTKVSVTVPLGNYAGDYGWGMKGNWPATVVDEGAQINATVFPPTSAPALPVARVDSPEQGAEYSYDGITPVQFRINYSGLSGSNLFPLTSLQLVFDDTPLQPFVVPTLGGENATASAWSPAIIDGGMHTIRAIAQNSSGGSEHSITINVRGPPRIVTQPADQRVWVGEPVTLSVTATGTGELSYQWQKNGSDIPDARSSTLLFPSAALDHGGDYRVLVSNRIGAATSAAAKLVVQPRPTTASNSVAGVVYFDADGRRGFDEVSGETGVAGVFVELRNAANQPIDDTTTDADGKYYFSVPTSPNTTYHVLVRLPAGLVASTPNEIAVPFSGNDVLDLSTGLALDFAAIRGMKANGYTIGYWSKNLEKTLADRSGGVQVQRPTLEAHTAAIRGYALARFHDLTMIRAAALMQLNTSMPHALLEKQLIAAEYNCANGAHLDQATDDTVTRLFIHWGEYILTNPDRFTTAYVLWAKDWFDAFNNSHGGLVKGPRAL